MIAQATPGNDSDAHSIYGDRVGNGLCTYVYWAVAGVVRRVVGGGGVSLITSRSSSLFLQDYNQEVSPSISPSKFLC